MFSHVIYQDKAENRIESIPADSVSFKQTAKMQARIKSILANCPLFFIY